jgi:hypothetical protein
LHDLTGVLICCVWAASCRCDGPIRVEQRVLEQLRGDVIDLERDETGS